MFLHRRWADRSICLKISGSAITGGPSSKIFWNRLCVEQSRPLRAMAFPCSSPTICTSKCLALVHNCIMKTGDPGTSATTCSYWARNCDSLVDLRIPLPPPPSDALIMTGYPMRSATSRASSTLFTIAFLKISSGMVPSSVRSAVRPSPLHGMEGTFAVCARMFAAILSPRTLITGDGGPRNVIPFSLSAFGSFGFSEAWPQPGHTASTFCCFAICTIRSTFA
mmetsp:Transcript_10656/g.39113  ORF Transcript_10656/g.39113 Transcript_10656/m.39113 type:complete len:223 (+) Transcript_10656:5967-6635(+)